METAVFIPHADLIALRGAASTDKSRPLLQNIHIGRDYVDATNGHVLYRVPAQHVAVDENGDIGAPLDEPPASFEPRLLHVDTLKGLRAGQGVVLRRNGIVEIWAEGGAGLRHGFSVLRDVARTLDGERFPDVARVMPDLSGETTTLVGIAPHYLRWLADAAKKHEATAVSLEVIPSANGDGSTRAITVRFVRDGALAPIMLVMPMRVDRGEG